MEAAFLSLAAVLGVVAVCLVASRKPGGGFLAFGFAALSLMLVLTATPLLWVLAGRPSESYPEYFAFVYGIPAGLCITLVAAIRFWLIRRRKLSIVMRSVALCLLPLLASGCASLGHPRSTEVEPRHVAGYYYDGDGLGTNISAQLRDDGSYETTWHGCLGEYGRSEGAWAVSGGVVTFTPRFETEMLVGYLREARVKSTWPNYKLIPTKGRAEAESVLYPYFPESQ